MTEETESKPTQTDKPQKARTSKKRRKGSDLRPRSYDVETAHKRFMATLLGLFVFGIVIMTLLSQYVEFSH